ncbi:MAG TPA: hypothetical protein VFX16_08600 [Pseudonocardiaceae bacterium]|nr:hypothetical protein [Pseudonocardiaceae bacterium]
MSSQPNPAPILELGRGLPGWVLRLTLLLVGCAAAVALLDDRLILIVQLILFALAVVTAAVPASPAPAMFIGVVAIVVALTPGDPLRPTVLLEIPLLHLVHIMASIAALVPRRAIIRPAALIKPARRFLFVQIAVFAIVGLAEILPTSQNSTVVELAGICAVAGLVLLAIRLLTRAK